MVATNKNPKHESNRVWGWILAIIGGLLTLLGIAGAIFLNFHAHQNVILGFLLCSAPFMAIGVLLIILGTRWKIREEKKKPTIMLGCGGIIVFLIVGIILVALVNNTATRNLFKGGDIDTSIASQLTYIPLPTYTNYPTHTTVSTNQPTRTQKSTNSPSPSPTGPTNTPLPTNTPRPTSTPTVTPLPNLITCHAIIVKHDGATDLQWQEYKEEAQGRNIYFSGKIRQVYEDNWASLESKDECGVSIYRIPHEIAVRLYKGQYVEGYGTIKKLSWFLWVADIDINIIPETFIIH
jgi:hypothetical protein